MAEGSRDRGDTLRGALAKLADAMVGLLRTRLELVAVEYTEERDRIARQLALLLVGFVCLLFALFFASFAVIAYYWDTHRIAAILGVAGFFVVIGAASCGGARKCRAPRRCRSPPAWPSSRRTAPPSRER